MAKLITGVNDLKTLYPEIASEWHPTKNGKLTPDNVLPGSNKKIWWKCINGHEWQAQIKDRTRSKHKCPVCTGKRVLPGYNDLATVNPELAAEWHPTKNGNLTPAQVTAGSYKNIWWKCPQCGHEWQAKIWYRNKGIGCPSKSCRQLKRKNERLSESYNLAVCYPEIAAEWHPTKNGALNPDQVLPGSNQTVWWLGKCGHEWQSKIFTRVKFKTQCPYCTGHKLLTGYNDLKTLHPDIADQWHPTKNRNLTPDQVTVALNTKVWWKCSCCGHEWYASIDNRVRRAQECPMCKRKPSRINKRTNYDRDNQKHFRQIPSTKNRTPKNRLYQMAEGSPQKLGL